MRVWYVTYGSNLSEARFRCYLGGGRPVGGTRLYTGCRDPRSPRRRVSLEVPGGLYFAGESSVWSGGRAYFDPGYADAPGSEKALDLGPVHNDLLKFMVRHSDSSSYNKFQS